MRNLDPVETSDAYRLDPETIAIRRQEAELRKARACGECRHVVILRLNDGELRRCEFKRRTYGVRCDLFRLKGERN